MTDGFQSPDERLEQPIDTDMPHSTSDVRELADVVRQLADAIDEAITLVNGAYEDTEDGGWDDDGADRFRASLVVGRTNASELETDVRTYAQKLDEYANALSAADERLASARESARGADLLDGTVIHPPEVGVYIGERMMAPDQRESGYEERRAREDAYYTARAEFDAAVEALTQPDGIPQFVQDVVKQTYFTSGAFVKEEIEKVAESYQQGVGTTSFLSASKPMPSHQLLPVLPDDLAARAVKSYGGSTINVFGIFLDVYTGTPIEEALFIGTGGVLGGIGGGVLLRLAIHTTQGPPGWALIVAQGVGSLAGGWASKQVWNSLPQDVRDWVKQRREGIENAIEEDNERSSWDLAYNRERGQFPGRDLKGP